MSIKEFILKYKWIMIILTLIPIVTIAAFAILEYVFKMIDLVAGEWASFIGAVLGYIGTVFLGTLAFWQNEKANDINKQLQQIENEKFKLEMQPYVILSEWELIEMHIMDIILDSQKMIYNNIDYDQDCSEKACCFKFKFINSSNALATVKYIEARLYSSETSCETWKPKSIYTHNTKLYLKSSEYGELNFFCTKDKARYIHGKVIQLDLELENRFGDRYIESMEISVSLITELKDGWFLSLEPHNYMIKRMEN